MCSVPEIGGLGEQLQREGKESIWLLSLMLLIVTLFSFSLWVSVFSKPVTCRIVCPGSLYLPVFLAHLLLVLDSMAQGYRQPSQDLGTFQGTSQSPPCQAVFCVPVVSALPQVSTGQKTIPASSILWGIHRIFTSGKIRRSWWRSCLEVKSLFSFTYIATVVPFIIQGSLSLLGRLGYTHTTGPPLLLLCKHLPKKDCSLTRGQSKACLPPPLSTKRKGSIFHRACPWIM